MSNLLNKSRPPVFCPGCAHEQVVRTLDRAFRNMGLVGNQICLVSDIGCSGLFDTAFSTHAFHGLHGRALTYAAGIKLCRPELNVVVTMGDGGLGIGGAHLLAACRRNVNVTLLVLNNFNFGMTGGQYSPTTPNEAVVGSGFLNQLENPMDLQAVAAAAGAPFVASVSTYQKDLTGVIEQAIRFDGFAIVEIQGLCPGHYTKRNRLTPKIIEEALSSKPAMCGPVETNIRPEYGEAYRERTSRMDRVNPPAEMEKRFTPPEKGLQGVILLGSAGQRVITAGELLSLAGLSAGLQVTQKNEYNITVLQGPSIAEVTLSSEKIEFTGIERPSVMLSLAEESVVRRAKIFPKLDETTLVIQAAGVEIPETKARVKVIDFNGQEFKTVDWALAGIGVMAKMNRVINLDMLRAALAVRFKGALLENARGVVDRVRV